MTFLCQVSTPDTEPHVAVCPQCDTMFLQCVVPGLLRASEQGLIFVSSFSLKVANTWSFIYSIIDYLKGKYCSAAKRIVVHSSIR